MRWPGSKRAVGYCPNVEFSPEDAARTESRFPLPGGRSGHRRRGHDGQHSRHGRLRHAQPHAPRHPDAPQPRAQHRQGRDQRPLPQRPGHGRGQQPGRRRGRRRADRVYDQRPGRAGRQLLAGRGRHGPADPQRLLSCPHQRQHPAAGAHQPAGGQRDRHPGAAQQGDRRPERLRPRGGHPPGRHAQGTHDLRDHAARGRRLCHHRAGAGQAQRPRRPGQPHQGPGLFAGRRADPARSSRRSRSWPTRRRRSTTPTSPP